MRGSALGRVQGGVQRGTGVATWATGAAGSGPTAIAFKVPHAPICSGIAGTQTTGICILSPAHIRHARNASAYVNIGGIDWIAKRARCVTVGVHLDWAPPRRHPSCPDPKVRQHSVCT